MRAQLARSSISVITAALLSATGCARSAAAHLDSGSTGDRDGSVDPDDALDHDDAPTRRDAPARDSGVACAISDGPAIALDGNNDLAKYADAQRVELGAMLGSDAAAIEWDPNHLSITMASAAFAGAFEPLHVYIEADHLDVPVASSGKEYSGLVPGLPFTPTHLIAVRQQDDGGAGAYDGVFVPDAGWTMRATALDASVFVAADHSAISVQVPWSALGGCPTTIRVAAHVVHAAVANEWKDLIPTAHTPWLATGGGYYEIDLTGAHTVASWMLR